LFLTKMQVKFSIFFHRGSLNVIGDKFRFVRSKLKSRSIYKLSIFSFSCFAGALRRQKSYITIDVFKIMIYSQSGLSINIYVNLTVTKRARNKCIRSAETHFSFGQFIHEEYVSMV
jgi:hypothetical protein